MHGSLGLSEPLTRCFGGPDDPLMQRYHDEEWGVPVHDDRLLFEFLALESCQAGLSWRTVLHKRAAYRKAFNNFDIATVAAYGDADAQRLLADAGIVRNRLKIAAIINNAGRVLEVQKEFGTFDAFIWQFTGGQTLRRAGLLNWADVPAVTPESGVMSRDLVRRGFKFVGPTICYAHMQATGMVNDHSASCWRAG
jgi:DNA-3-methyladenine glycosylase I